MPRNTGHTEQGQVLSRASVYEQMFGTRKRAVGRPNGDTEPLFASATELDAYDDDVVTAAKRRAYAVVHEENRSRLREVFLKELRVLQRRKNISKEKNDA